MVKKPRGEPKEESFGEFPELLVKLGKEVEAKIEEKARLEQELNLKEGITRKLENEIFSIKKRLARLSTELAKLEIRKKEKEENSS